MRTAIISLFLLAACEAEPVTLDTMPVDQAALPVALGEPDMAVGELLRGQTVRMMYAGLQPGLQVTFVHGSALGSGPCYPLLGGGCLDITGPIQVVGSSVVNSEGYAELNVRVPRSVRAGSAHAFQAVAFDAAGAAMGISDAVARTEGFGICPLFFSPTCGVDGIDYSNECFAGFGGSVVSILGSFCP